MAAGFVHGVLNTDNMNVTGESFDYGPYRFLPVLDPDFVAAYFDPTGLYAFGRQPATVHWNLARLADALAPLTPGGTLASALAAYDAAFTEASTARSCRASASCPVGPDEDEALVVATLAFLREPPCGLRSLLLRLVRRRRQRSARAGKPRGVALRGPCVRHVPPAARAIHAATPRAPRPALLAAYGPCTLLIDDVEAVWAAIAERDDWRPFEAQLEAIEELRRASNPPVGAAAA